MEKVREEDRLRREEEAQLGENLAQEIEQEEQRKLQEAQDQESLGLEAARKMWKDITTTPVSRKRHKSVLDLLKSSSKSTKIKASKEVTVSKNSLTKNGLLMLDSMENSKHQSTTTETNEIQ